jgi:hypothetical protein
LTWSDFAPQVIFQQRTPFPLKIISQISERGIVYDHGISWHLVSMAPLYADVALVMDIGQPFIEQPGAMFRSSILPE